MTAAPRAALSFRIYFLGGPLDGQKREHWEDPGLEFKIASFAGEKRFRDSSDASQLTIEVQVYHRAVIAHLSNEDFVYFRHQSLTEDEASHKMFDRMCRSVAQHWHEHKETWRE